MDYSKSCERSSSKSLLTQELCAARGIKQLGQLGERWLGQFCSFFLFLLGGWQYVNERS